MQQDEHDYAPAPLARRRDHSISSRRLPDRLNSVSSVLALDVEASVPKRVEDGADDGETPGGWNVSTPVARKFGFPVLKAADKAAALEAVKAEEHEPTKDIPGYFPHIENLDSVRQRLEAASVVVESAGQKDDSVSAKAATSSSEGPKLLPDEPTVKSPLKTDLPTPPGAADAFRLHSQGTSGSEQR